eukprot:7436465-Alexandrium_andersonii.AAC.1
MPEFRRIVGGPASQPDAFTDGSARWANLGLWAGGGAGLIPPPRLVLHASQPRQGGHLDFA